LSISASATTVGRIIFNQIVAGSAPLQEREHEANRAAQLVDECYRILGPAETANVVDGVKGVGFEYATPRGMTIAVTGHRDPARKGTSPEWRADAAVEQTRSPVPARPDHRRRAFYEQVVDVWQKTTNDLSSAMMDGLDPFGSVRMMSDSGARGNKGQISQLGGMRGLMADPSGRIIIDVPVRSNFREGMTVLEYFISTHGARKGLADTALRTADSGLPDPASGGRGPGCHHPRRRLRHPGRQLDHSVRVGPRSPATNKGAYQKRMVGRSAQPDLFRSETGALVVERNQEISEAVAGPRSDESGIDESPRPLTALTARLARASVACATAVTSRPASWSAR